MKKGFWAILCASALILTLGVTTALAADADAAAQTPQIQGGGLTQRGGGTRPELTDEQKAQMEAERAQREEEQTAFLATLTEDQRALYDAMTPARPGMGEAPAEETRDAQPDEAAMEAMSEAREAFIASLSEEQKAQYEKLFTGHGGGLGGMTEEQRAEMEEKIAAFKAMLSDEQAAALEAMMPAQPAGGTKPAEGERPQKPDEADMTAKKAQQEAFEATLSEEQKAAYDDIFAKPERPAKTDDQAAAA